MSKKLVVKLNLDGITELKRGDGVHEMLEEYRAKAAQNLPDGYAYSFWYGKRTSGVAIYPETKEAGLDNYRNNTLLKETGWF